MGNDLMYLFLYADQVTGNTGISHLFSILVVLSFFLVVLIGSLVAQQRFTGNIRPETSVLAASFVATGFEIIMMQRDLIPIWFFLLSLIITIGSFLWVAMSSSETP